MCCVCLPTKKVDADTPACERHEVRPPHLVAELLLHLRQEAAGLVQVGVVAPLVLGPVPLPSSLAAAAAVGLVRELEAPGAVPR